MKIFLKNIRAKFLKQIFFGQVQIGQQYAGKLGIPTANLEFPKCDNVVPGVYASICKLKSDKSIIKYPSMSYISPNSTVLETHIFDFDKNIYGMEIFVELLQFIRKPIAPIEFNIKPLQEKIEQIQNDIIECKSYFKGPKKCHCPI